MNRSSSVVKFSSYAFGLLLAVIYILVMSTSTSPFYFNFSGDSAFFQVFGKAWSEGMIPYVDIWDQKGPLIFLVNMVGYTLTGNRYGVMLVQILCMWVTFQIAWAFLRKHYDRNKAILLFFVFISFMTYPFEVGNTVEEYKTPLMLWSFCLMCDWTNRYREIPLHRPLDAFVYGLTIGACFLSRLIDGFPLFLGVMVIAFYLGYKKAWRNLWHNAVGVTLGFMLPVIPFVIYFYSHDALWWFWYGTIGFNMEYFHSSTHSWTGLWDLTRYAMQVILPFCLLLYGGILNLRDRGKNVEGYLWMIVGASTVWWILKSFGYTHYAYVTLPYLLILYVKIKPFSVLSDRRFLIVSLRGLFVFLLVCLSIFLPLKMAKVVYSAKNDALKKATFLKQNEEALAYIPKGEWNQAIFHNAPAPIYLHNNLRPYCKFYSFQDFMASNSPSFPGLLLEEYSRRPAKWIVYYGVTACPRQSPIYKLLSSRYRKIHTRGSIPFSIYKLRKQA